MPGRPEFSPSFRGSSERDTSDRRRRNKNVTYCRIDERIPRLTREPKRVWIILLEIETFFYLFRSIE